MVSKFETWRIKEHSNDICYWEESSWCRNVHDKCSWDIYVHIK